MKSRATWMIWIVLGVAACGEGDTPIQPRQWAIEALTLDAEIAPTHAIAGDTVDLVVTLTNDRDHPIVLRDQEACVVSSFRVSRNEERVSFVGDGALPCPEGGRLTIPASGSAEVTVPLVVWQEPDSTTSPLLDGPPWPRAYAVVVRSELLGKEAGAQFNVLASGLHEKSAPICGPTPAGSDPVEIVLRPDVIEEEWLRVRFEIHNRSRERLLVERCSAWVVTAFDRREGEGWLLGERVTWCSQGPGTGLFDVPVGGCLRGVDYEHDFRPGEYRLRIWTGSDTLVTRSMAFE